MDVDIFANVLYGLGSHLHKDGKHVASLLIPHIERTFAREWRPRTIARMAWGVARLDAHGPAFVGKILRETIKSGRFFTPSEVQMFQEAVDEMNVEPVDEVWQSFLKTES